MKTILFLFMLATVQAGFAQQLKLKWRTDTVFRVPESVYLDAKNNLLYISNIEGKSDQKDGLGFVSKVTTDGKIIKLDWVDGLDAPKGMGMFNDKLYVADLTRVVEIDTKTASIVHRYEIEGAKFLNDITVDDKGNVYISDSATGKIHVLRNGQVEIYFESPDFKRVNGLLALKDELYVADAGTGIHYKLTSNKTLNRFAETSQGADGVVMVGKNEFIVSSWGGEIYYVDATGKSTKMLDTREQKLNSADIAFDPKTKTVFVPTFFGNSIMAYTFSKR